MSEEKRYAVCPGYVTSISDGDKHYIGASQLMRLYGVSPEQCYVFRHDHSMRGIDLSELVFLRPRVDGNYALPTARGASDG